MLRHSIFTLAILSTLVGCSSSDPPATGAPVDGGSDTATTDTKMPAPDTKPQDTGSGTIACKEPVDDVVCLAPLKAAGQTACNDAMLMDLAEKCLGADIKVPTACADWKAANAACASCVKAWSWSAEAGGPAGDIYPDDWKCYWSVFDAPCAKSVNCMFDCQYTACGNCESGSAERRNCFDSVSKAGGECYDLAAKDGNACFETFKTPLEGCNVDEMYAAMPNVDTLKQQVVRFLRGACRDGGNWTNSANPLDGGVTDTGTDTATGDTSAADSATSDSATSDAADAD